MICLRGLLPLSTKPSAPASRGRGHRRARPLAAALAALFLVAGTGVPAPDAAASGRFGPRLSEQAAKPIAPSRYKGMDSRKISTQEGTFTMEQAVRHALDYNPSLGSDEAQARSSEEGRKSDLAAFGPKLSTTYSYSKQARVTSANTVSGLPSRGTYSWTVEVSQNIFAGFATMGTYEKQALQVESDRATLRSSELDMTQSVQEAFITYLCALEDVNSQSEAVARLRDQLEITEAYHEVGLRPKLDVLQAKVDLGEAEQELITTENTRDTTLAQLNTLLGLPAIAHVRYAGSLTEPRFEKTLEQCLDVAYRLRPDLYIGYKAVEMAVKDRVVARADYFPSIDAYYDITKEGNTPDLERGGSNSTRSTVWEVGARLTWDVFQWGNTYFADQQAGWLVAKMRSEVHSLTLNAGYDVKEKFLALREARKRIVVARDNVAHAREAWEAALGQYREQVGTNFDVLDASSNLLTAQSDLTSARGDYLTALSRLYVAMGEFHPDLR